MGVPQEEEVQITAGRVAEKVKEFYKQFGLQNLQASLQEKGQFDDRSTFVQKMIPLVLDDFKSRLWMPPIHREEDRTVLMQLLEAVYDEP